MSEKIDYDQIEGFGNLPSLNTTNKSSLVDAVNEVNTKATNATLTSGLHTTVASNQVNVAFDINTPVTDKGGNTRLLFGNTQATDTVITMGATSGDFSVKTKAGAFMFRISGSSNVPYFTSIPNAQTGTGNLAFFDAGNGLWKHQLTIADLITTSNIGGYIPSAQNLSIGTQTGQIDISGGGTSARLTSLYPSAAVNDWNVNPLTSSGLFVINNNVGSSNYPTANAGGGLSYFRGANPLGSFQLWTDTANTDKVYLRTGATATTFNTPKIIATEEWIATQNFVQNITGGYLEKASLAVAPVAAWDTILENRIVHSTSASNSPFTQYGIGINFGGVSNAYRAQLFFNTNPNANSLQFRTASGTGWLPPETVATQSWVNTNSHPLDYTKSANATAYALDLLTMPLGSYSSSVSTTSTNRPFTNVGGLISFGAGNQTTRILGARDNSDNLWFQSGDGTGAWRKLASREYVDANFAPLNSLGSYLPLAGGTMTGTIEFTNTALPLISAQGIGRLYTNLTTTTIYGNQASGTGIAIRLRPIFNSSAGEVTINGNGQINTTNHGDSSQWKQAYDWGRGLRVDGNSIAINNSTASSTSVFTVKNASMWATTSALDKFLNSNSAIVNFSALPGYGFTLAARNGRIGFSTEENTVNGSWLEIIHTNNLDSQATALGFIKSSSIPAQVNITQGTGITVSGTYPNITITNSDPNVFQTLSQVGQVVTLSNGGGSFTLPTATTYTAGTGLSLTGTTFGQTITTSGAGAFVTGITQTTNGFQVNLGNIPVLNQNTTGTAGSLSTARNIRMTGDVDWQVNFNGSANVSAAGTIASNAVDFTKIQQINAGRLLGKGSSGTGNVQEIQLGTNLSMSGGGVLSATDTKPSTDYIAISGNGQSVSVNKSETIVNILSFTNTNISSGVNDGDILHVTGLATGGSKVVNITHIAKDGSTQGSFNTEGQTTRFLWVASIPRWVNIS